MRKSDNRKQFKASILALALTLAPWGAEAAGLGRLTVLSALGEPLRAEIEVTANNDEYASMAARLASSDAFKNAGIEYVPTLAGIRFALERRPNGQAVVSVKSERPINDPFIDMLVEVNWASGRLVREYTFLLDPPELFRSPALAAAPEVRKETVAPTPTPAPAVETPPAAALEKAAPVPAEKTQPAARPAPKAAEQPAAKPAPAAEATRTVRKGDTLGRIASETRPEGVSLDQMLVALFRSNPDAFDGGNMNRLRAGKILGLPDKETIAAVDAGEARKIVVAQSADFNAYRQKLATLAAAAPAREEAPRQAAAGRIEPRVEEKAPAQPAGKDKLEVSRTEAAKGGKPGAQAPGRVTEEDLMARDKALKDARSRIAELEKNLNELRKLAEMRSAAGAKLQEQAEAKKAEPPAPKPAEAPKPAPAVVAEAPKPAETAKPAEPPKPAEAPKPPPAPAVKPPPPPPAPPAPPPSFVEDNPGLVFGGAGILALLLAYFGLKSRRSRRQAEAAPVSMAAAEPTASVFGTTGGQSVDTGSALPTDFSQDSTSSTLVADEGIDPVAEADVYMAYGRDRQAEEILLEALKTEPTRAAIHLKLLEIYAARKSLSQFEGVARELFALTGGSGPDWEKAAALGRSLDPANPLYSGAAPAPAPAAPASEASAMATMIMPAAIAQEMTAETPPETEPAETSADEAPMSLDFDLDLGEEPAAAPPVAAEEPAAEEPPAEEAMSLDFDLDLGAAPPAEEETAAEPAAAEGEATGLDFDLSMPAAEAPAEAETAETAEAGGDANALDFDFDLGEADKPAAVEPPAEPMAGMPALDLSAISLELDEETQASAAAPEAEPAPAEETLPDIEAPAIEMPAIETPAIETPAIETPAIETPAIETPAIETPAAEEPAAESPAALEVPAAVIDDPEVATKLELAQAYEEMGDKEGARELLYEVLNEGSPAQQEAARVKLAQLG